MLLLRRVLLRRVLLRRVLFRRAQLEQLLEVFFLPPPAPLVCYLQDVTESPLPIFSLAPHPQRVDPICIGAFNICLNNVRGVSNL